MEFESFESNLSKIENKTINDYKFESELERSENSK